jgi:hypothetical protein
MLRKVDFVVLLVDVSEEYYIIDKQYFLEQWNNLYHKGKDDNYRTFELLFSEEYMQGCEGARIPEAYFG